MNFRRSFSKFFKRKVQVAIQKTELMKFLPKQAVILEAGVYDGADTEEFARTFPQGRIYGFECLPGLFAKAEKRLEQYPNVKLYPQALNDQSGVFNFHVSTEEDYLAGSGSLLPPKLHLEIHPNIKFENIIQVEAITIDAWAAENNIEVVDFLWLDMQGAEIKALQGASDMLTNIRGIFTEVSLLETYQGVPLYDEVRAFLGSKGFRIHKEFLPFKDMGNVLFLR